MRYLTKEGGLWGEKSGVYHRKEEGVSTRTGVEEVFPTRVD